MFGRVFGVFAGEAKGGVAAGDNALDEVGGDGEGGWAFAGVEDAEAAAGAGADVEEAAAALEPGSDLVHGSGDLGELGADGRGDGASSSLMTRSMSRVESWSRFSERGLRDSVRSWPSAAVSGVCIFRGTPSPPLFAQSLHNTELSLGLPVQSLDSKAQKLAKYLDSTV